MSGDILYRENICLKYKQSGVEATLESPIAGWFAFDDVEFSGGSCKVCRLYLLVWGLQ